MSRVDIVRNAGFFLMGAGLGAIAGKLAFEKKLREEYEESQQALVRSLERLHQGHTINVYGPVATEDELEDASDQEKSTLLEGKDFDGETELVITGDITRGDDDEDVVPQYINHYQRALDNAQPVEIQDTSSELFVDGGINDYGVSYIEEDDFDDDDGRFKGQITMVMGHNGNPDFFMDGVQIQDWAERVGDSIIVDFYQHVPPNAPPILYVRNHKRDEDYEVTREMP